MNVCIYKDVNKGVNVTICYYDAVYTLQIAFIISLLSWNSSSFQLQAMCIQCLSVKSDAYDSVSKECGTS